MALRTACKRATVNSLPSLSPLLSSVAARALSTLPRGQSLLPTQVTPDNLTSKLVVRNGGRSSVSGLTVTVFGSTGFLGGHVVTNLAMVGTQVVIPYRGDGLETRTLKQTGDNGQVVPLPYQLHDEESVRRAVSRSHVVVNLVGAQKETSNYNFHDANVKTAYRIAKISKEMGVERFIHLSSVNADPKSDSRWYSAKGESEQVVRSFFPNATILKSTSMFGWEDGLAHMARRTSVMPLFFALARGLRQVQPVYVEDVANAVMNAAHFPEAEGKIYWLGGKTVYSQLEVIQMVAKNSLVSAPVLAPPESFNLAVGALADYLPIRWRNFCKDDVYQARYDDVVPDRDDILTLRDLQVPATELAEKLPWLLSARRGNRWQHITTEDKKPPMHHQLYAGIKDMNNSMNFRQSA